MASTKVTRGRHSDRQGKKKKKEGETGEYGLRGLAETEYALKRNGSAKTNVSVENKPISRKIDP